MKREDILQKGQTMKLPMILMDYFEAYEMDVSKMTKNRLLREAEYAADPSNGFVNPVDERGCKVYDEDEYSPQQIAALTKFINRLRKEICENG